MPDLLERPRTASTAMEAHAANGSGTAATSQTYVVESSSEDYLVEAAIKFVPGLKARPSRDRQDEPEGSGPFGF